MLREDLQTYDGGLTERIIGLAIKVHRLLGPGLMESVYESCLDRELCRVGLTVARQVWLPVFYDGMRLDDGYRVDLIVDERVVLEIKSVEHLTPLHQLQLLTYLRLGGYRIGLLMNFNSVRLKDGLRRFVM
jgi:GxxExxY protein